MNEETEPKYEFCGKKGIRFNGKDYQLYQIKAVREFRTKHGRLVKRGDKGGWIDNTTTLSHKGNCWIFPGICVMDNSSIHGQAELFHPRMNEDWKVDVFLTGTTMKQSSYAELEDVKLDKLTMRHHAELYAAYTRGTEVSILNDGMCILRKAIPNPTGEEKVFRTDLNNVALGESAVLFAGGYFKDCQLCGNTKMDGLFYCNHTKLRDTTCICKETEEKIPARISFCRLISASVNGKAPGVVLQCCSAAGVKLQGTVKITGSELWGTIDLKEAVLKDCLVTAKDSASLIMDKGTYRDVEIEALNKGCVMIDEIIFRGTVKISPHSSF